MRHRKTSRDYEREWRVLRRRWAGRHDWATKMVRDWAAQKILRFAHPLLLRPMQSITCQGLEAS